MDKRTTGIIATVISALICGCAAIFACVWGIIVATNTPINVTNNGQQSTQSLPTPVGYVLLCLSILFILVPIAVGFFTLRNKPAAPDNNEPIPPAA